MLLASLLALSIAPFHFSGQTEIRSAYHTRGKIVEDRPIQVIDSRASVDAGSFGRVGAWYWGYSSWTGRRQNVHRRMFNESDIFAFWEYEWKISERWSFHNQLSHIWVGLPGYKPGKEIQNTKEWWYSAALKNPYIIPSMLMRRGWDNEHWIYFMVGLSKPFDLGTAIPSAIGLPDSRFTVTPGVFTEICDSALYDLRYGDKLDGSSYHAGFMSVIGQVSLNWQLCENISAFVNLQQFGMLDRDARERTHAPNRRDLTIFTIGCRLSF